MTLSPTQLNQAHERKTPPRVRFAPSPTGFLHIGGARTALFNWLFAQKERGTFVVRIEDTDKTRSEKRFEEDILTSLHWLGITWDEGPDVGGPYGPYRQSERISSYRKHLTMLLEQGNAYYCFCKKEDLEKEKEALLAQGIPPRYSGRCRAIPYADAQTRRINGEQSVIRIKTPQAPIIFHDLLRGNMKFDSTTLEDFIIAKDRETPLYNFAATLDDHEMNITHVIRGEEHLSNTPRQIIIQRLLGLTTPLYAHVPLILNADKSKLSKRYADTALNDYRTKGYLPEALINFMALLGWHPTGDRELFTTHELIETFDLMRIQKAGAVFNYEKLDWFNKHYIATLSDEDLLTRVTLCDPQRVEKYRHLPHKTLHTLIALEKSRMTTMLDFGTETEWFFSIEDYDPALLIWKDATRETIRQNLTHIKIIIETTNDVSSDALQSLFNPIIQERGRGEIFWPLRVALSGKKQSPPPFALIEALGKEKTIERITNAIQKLV